MDICSIKHFNLFYVQGKIVSSITDNSITHYSAAEGDPACHVFLINAQYQEKTGQAGSPSAAG
jgi:hypothetical protein